jgi:hypothetical protein
MSRASRASEYIVTCAPVMPFPSVAGSGGSGGGGGKCCSSSCRPRRSRPPLSYSIVLAFALLTSLARTAEPEESGEDGGGLKRFEASSDLRPNEDLIGGWKQRWRTRSRRRWRRREPTFFETGEAEQSGRTTKTYI